MLLGVGLAMSSTAALAQNRTFSFAYDQPKNSGYGVGAEMFNKKLMELSKGTLSINQYPGAQLGTEAQTLQKVQTGDIDFVHAVDRQRLDRAAGIRRVLDPLHFPRRSARHQSAWRPAVIAAMKELYAAKMKGAHMLGLGSQGLRHMYGKKPVQKVADLKGIKMRVQATVTEDTLFPAYGAQVVHMPFGEVYTSLQTGVVDMAENGINNYLINKHYEPAPVLSLTEHEANNAALFVSDKVWRSLSDRSEEMGAGRRRRSQPERAGRRVQARARSAGEAEKIGVKVVKDVDKSGFATISKPIQDKLAKDLGPHAVKVLELVRNVK